VVFSQIKLDSPALDFGATIRATKFITEVHARQADIDGTRDLSLLVDTTSSWTIGWLKRIDRNGDSAILL
jgi:hypothetical protein